jgi:hypothetical protein
MKYALKVLALGHSKLVNITAEEFKALEKAQNVLSGFSNLTENYRIVLDAYNRVETVSHETALNHIIYGFSAYSGVLDTRVVINSALIGYLAAARYFLDSTDKLLPHLLQPSDVSAFNKFRSEYYDANKEYCFIEALRNHVQHRDLPVDGIKYHNFVEDTKKHSVSDLVTAVSLYVMREKLEADEKFKKQALTDMPGEIDVIQCTRSHMAGLWALHDYLLKNHGVLAANARNVVGQARDKFNATINGSLLGLHAVAATDDGVIKEQVPLLLDWDDARLQFLKNVGNLKNLQKRYVSGKIQKG